VLSAVALTRTRGAAPAATPTDAMCSSRVTPSLVITKQEGDDIDDHR
jgi:hypothetical protein